MTGTPVGTSPTKRTTPQLSNVSAIKSVFRDVTTVENITDETSLQKYLNEYKKHEASLKIVNKSQQSTNLLSSFWSHPVTKTAKDMNSFLAKCHYQLSTLSPG